MEERLFSKLYSIQVQAKAGGRWRWMSLAETRYNAPILSTGELIFTSWFCPSKTVCCFENWKGGFKVESPASWVCNTTQQHLKTGLSTVKIHIEPYNSSCPPRGHSCAELVNPFDIRVIFMAIFLLILFWYLYLIILGRMRPIFWIQLSIRSLRWT